MKKLTITLSEDNLLFIHGLLRKQASEECIKAKTYMDVHSASYVLDVLSETMTTTEVK